MEESTLYLPEYFASTITFVYVELFQCCSSYFNEIIRKNSYKLGYIIKNCCDKNAKIEIGIIF